MSVSEFEGKPILKIEKEGLTAMANAAFRDVSFMLRRSHNEQVAKILSDPEASDNDKYVALTLSGYRYGHHPRRERPAGMDGLLRRRGPVVGCVQDLY